MTVTGLLNKEILESEHGYVFTKFLSSKISGSSSETLFGEVQNCSMVNHDHVNSHILLPLAKVEPSLEYTCNCQIKLLSPYKVQKFENSHLNYLRVAYEIFLPDVDILDIPQQYKRHNLAQWWSQHVGYVRHSGDNDKRTVIYAYWIGSDGKIASNCDGICAGLAHVDWYQDHLNPSKYGATHCTSLLGQLHSFH